MKIVTTILGLMVAALIIAVAIIPVTDSIGHDEVKTVDILLIDGQSNGAYSADIPSRCNPAIVNDELGKPGYKALYYGTEDSSSNEVSENSMIREMYRDNEWKIGGEEAGLAYHLMQKNHRDVLVINIAFRGIGIKNLATGAQWENGKAVIEAALAEINEEYENINNCGLVMIHGEADKAQTIAYYEEYFMILFDNLNDYGFKKCYFVLPRYQQGVNAYDAMLDLAKKNNNIYTTNVTSTFTIQNGLLNTDNLHYTQMGRLLVSEAVVNMIPTNANYSQSMSTLIQTIPLIMFATLAVIAASAIYMRRGDE